MNIYTCPNCKAEVIVHELPMGVPGGKDREDAYCPSCGTVVTSIMTDGFVRTELADSETNQQ